MKMLPSGFLVKVNFLPASSSSYIFKSRATFVSCSTVFFVLLYTGFNCVVVMGLFGYGVLVSTFLAKSSIFLMEPFKSILSTNGANHAG